MHKQEALEQAKIKDSVELLYKNSFGGIITCIISATVLVFAFPENTQQSFKQVWWFLIISLMLLRLADSVYWKFWVTPKNIDIHPKFWKHKFTVGALLTAGLWGVYGPVVLSGMAQVEFFSTVIIMAALAGSAPTVLSADRFLATSYSVLLILPLSLAGIFSSDAMQQLLGIMGIVLTVSMIYSAGKIAQYTSIAMDLKNENQFLLESVSTEKSKIERKNDELRHAYRKIKSMNDNLEDEVAERTKEILLMSQTDSLTGLLNRPAFLQQLATKVAFSKQTKSAFSLFFIDLNGFKKINDTLGHDVGDQILVHVANTLKTAGPHFAIARWGGDEFVMATDIINEEEALAFAKSLNTELKKPRVSQHNEVAVQAAIGIAFYPLQTNDSSELLRMADAAMFEHKKFYTDRPGMIFEPWFLAKLARQEKLRMALQSAHIRKELKVLFQPIVDTRDGSVNSYECLLRWYFEGKWIPPEEFIPLAEKSKTIIELGSWALDESCLQAKAHLADSTARICVNVSILQILDDDFEDMVLGILQKNDFPPNRLQLEITETVCGDNLHLVQSRISALNQVGITFGLDDFGTGYSSLKQLQTLPISKVKIDKYFVKTLTGDGSAIIKAARLLANELNLEVVAEGVETKQQVQQLQELGVYFAQGYYYSEPSELTHTLGQQKIITSEAKSLH